MFGSGCGLGCAGNKRYSIGMGDDTYTQFDTTSQSDSTILSDLQDFGNSIGLNTTIATQALSLPSIGSTPSIPSSSSSSINPLTQLANSIANIAGPILKAQFGGPQPGQYFATTPGGGSVAYALPSGSTSNVFSAGLTSLTSSSLFLPILLIGGAFLLFSGRK